MRSDYRKSSISIIGAGAVGTAWARALRRANFIVDAVISRNLRSAEKLARLAGSKVHSTDPAACAGADVVLISVPDHEIKNVARALQKVHFAKKHVILAHHAGSLTSDELKSTGRNRFSTLHRASLHPMQTFPRKHMRKAGWDPMRHICFGFEGDTRAKTVLRRLVRALDCTLIDVPGAFKPMYHMGGIIVSNFMHAAFLAARTIYRRAGFTPQQTRVILQPIMMETLGNILDLPAANLLTGPAARGDQKLLKNQARLLRRHHRDFERAFVAMNDYCRIVARKGTK